MIEYGKLSEPQKPWGGGLSRRIFGHIISLENLFLAWEEFKKGKQNKRDVILFSLNLENNIFALRKKLILGRWMSDGYTVFSIQDPKPRKIHKATVQDRILYHAVYRVLYSLFDSTFIHDSYSSRKGKGTHAGIERLNIWVRKLSRNYTHPIYALKCDIRKFFDSIDHEILLARIKQGTDCPQTIELLARIIDSFHKTHGKGLPLGNVTSQVFANVYMNPFDWYVKMTLRIKYYIRYCDDFVILSRDRGELVELIPKIRKFLTDNLRLELHPNKILIRNLHQGIDFLGAVLLPYRIVQRTRTKKRIIKKTQKLLCQLQEEKITKSQFNQTVNSFLGHLSHTKSFKVRCFLHKLKFSAKNLP
ncbi:MAG: reverse transcriptase/maturase family protein [bacterium]